MRGDDREKDRRRRKRAWAWWLWALLGLLLLLGLGIFATTVYTAVHVPQPTESACCSLFSGGQAPAQSVAFSVIGWLAVFLDDPGTDTQTHLVESFAANGTWSTATINAFGQGEIDALLTDYYFSSYEFFVTNTIQDAYWDYTQSTLTVAYLHEALTGDERYMWDDDFVVTQYSSETSFAQDRVSIFQFDCSYRLVYMRTYYNDYQRVSTYTTDHPAVCSRCTGACVSEEHITAAQRAIIRGARAQNALVARNGPRSASANQAASRALAGGRTADNATVTRPDPSTRRPKPVGVPVHRGVAP